MAVGQHKLPKIMETKKLAKLATPTINSAEHVLLQLLEIETNLHEEDADPPRAVSLQADPNKIEFHRADQRIPSRCRYGAVLGSVRLEKWQYLDSQVC